MAPGAPLRTRAPAPRLTAWCATPWARAKAARAALPSVTSSAWGASFGSRCLTSWATLKGPVVLDPVEKRWRQQKAVLRCTPIRALPNRWRQGLDRGPAQQFGAHPQPTVTAPEKWAGPITRIASVRHPFFGRLHCRTYPSQARPPVAYAMNLRVSPSLTLSSGLCARSARALPIIPMEIEIIRALMPDLRVHKLARCAFVIIGSIYYRV